MVTGLSELFEWRGGFPDTMSECTLNSGAIMDVPKPVTLKDIKANEKLSKMSLVTSMRLSVQPVTDDEWAEVCRMGGFDNPPR